MAAQQSKVLRVGVIQGGKIVEERVIPARQPVTIGTSTKNTIIVPQSNLAASVSVFTWQGDRYLLCFEDGMDGRIQGPQGAADFGALVSQGLAKREGRGHAVQVGEDQKGLSIVGGEVELREVVSALNALGATPRDLISIFAALKKSGALQADVEVM